MASSSLLRAPSERRRHTRQARKINVAYRCVGGPNPRDVDDRTGHVVNISRGGVMLMSDRRLPEGSVVELHLPSRVFSGGPKVLHGIVRRIGHGTAAGEYPLGVMFVRVMSKPNTQRFRKPVSDDRRKHIREDRRAIVKIRCESSPGPHAGGEVPGLLNNISPVGVGLSSSHPYPPGSIVHVRVPRSPFGAAPGPEMVGTVVWMESGEQEGQYRLGVAFKQLS